MTIFAGFDRSAFPGLGAMAWLKKNTNLAWCGFYLGAAPSHPETDWMRQWGLLRTQGWGLAPIYVGQEVSGPGDHEVTAARGGVDGRQAAMLMRIAGAPGGSFAYLDLESPDPETPYLEAWAAGLSRGSYRPGVYCSHLIAAEVSALLPKARIWAYRVATVAPHGVAGTEFSTEPPGAGSGFAGAAMWQHDQNALISCAGATLEVDLSTSISADPSAP